MKKEEKPRRVLCRVGNHLVWRNQIAVYYEPGVGLCGQCIVRRTAKLRDYWTKGRAMDSAADAGGVKQGALL